MPITTPIEGAGFGPIVTRQYAVFGAVDVSTSTRSPGINGLEIEGLSQRSSINGVEVIKARPKPILSSIQIVNYTTTNVLRASEVISGDSFMILADVLASELTAANLALAAYVHINARLEIDGEEIAIKNFNFQKPTGSIGSLLNVTLADPDYELIQTGISLDFSIVVKVGATEFPVPLMSGSALSEDDFTLQYRGGSNGGPIDSVTFGALDAAGDRFRLTPERPVKMFDPQRVPYTDVKTDPENAIRDDATGRTILPIMEPVSGLTMKKILNRAYTSAGSAYTDTLSEIQRSAFAWGSRYVGSITDVSHNNGCGFDRVITNIKDYKVREAHFTIEGGWHAGAQPCVQPYDPIYFPSGENDLTILNIDQPLEPGVTVYDVLLSYHKKLSQRRQYRPDTNQVLLTYQYSGNDPDEEPQKLSREVEEVTTPFDSSDPKTQDNPIGRGAEGYVKHRLRKRVREYYYADEPDNVLDTLPILTELTVEQTYVLRDDAGDVIFSGVRTSLRDRTDHYYNGDLAYRIDHTVESRLFQPNGAGLITSDMITAQQEDTWITWIDDPVRPGVKLQDTVVSTLYERCVISPEVQTIEVDGDPIDHYPMIPLIDANLGGYLTGDWKLTPQMVKSTTRTSILQKKKGNQFDVLVTDIDHLNGGGAKQSLAEPVTGSNDHDMYAVKSRTRLIKDADSIALIGPRIPEQVNAYELPRERALELGRQKLYRFTHPLRNMPIDLPLPDFALDRGSVIRGQTRDGFTSKFIVTGLSITGQSLGKPYEHRIFETLETLELMPE